MNELLSFDFVLFCVAVAAIMFVVRKLVEFVLQAARTNHVWRGLVLPLLPIAVGVGLAHVEGKGILIGLAGGLLSGVVYRVVKEFLNKQGK